MKELNQSPAAFVPTLADVAKAAGVSTATVSRALNSPARVSKTTLSQVMKAVETLGYSPNYSARALAAGRTNTFGAIIPTMENAIFARGIQAFQEELQQNGCTLFVASSSYRPELEEEQIKTLTARGADALLLIGYQRDPKIYGFLEKRQVPVVLTWAFDQKSDHLCVGFDNRQAMKRLAQEVIRHGHRKIGCISAVLSFNDRARNRVEGIRQAMTDAGLDGADLKLIETTYSIDSGDQAFARLMAEKDPPTAVLCGNDVLAVGALRSAAKIGIRVPDDVSVTGFDNIELAGVAHVPLTTVHVPHRRMGLYAARVLMDVLKGKSPKSLALPTEIRRRDSLASPP